MNKLLIRCSLLLLILLAGNATADNYAKTIEIFKRSEAVKPFFSSAYGYAVFPTIGKGGFVVGGAHGKGKVYRGGRVTGTTDMTQLTVGFQAGGQAFSQVIFFQDARAYQDFTSGNFEFSAQATAIAITSTAGAQATTTGQSAGAGDLQSNAKYFKGMLIFTRGKGGLMFEAAVGGQKFNFQPL